MFSQLGKLLKSAMSHPEPLQNGSIPANSAATVFPDLKTDVFH